MKIVTLMENTSSRPDLTSEHGLSLYIETGKKRILFDAGQSDGFWRNAETLGIDLSRVDFAVLSHGHYDHGGGMLRFLQINDHAPVYVHPEAFGRHYNASGKYIGLDSALRESDRLILIKENRTIEEGIKLHTGSDAVIPAEPFGLTMERNGCRVPEDFRHEQYLLIREGEKTILFSGCSHRGIENIVQWFQPDVLIGGFHFSKLDPASPRLTEAARQLLKYPTVYYTGHCTGQTQYAAMKEVMGDRLHELSTGSILKL